MPAFHYKALSQSGKIVSGQLDCVSEAALANQLRREGLYLVKASNEAAHGQWHKLLAGLRAGLLPADDLSERAMALFFSELSTLLDAGLELDRALEMLKSFEDLSRNEATIEAVLSMVRGGKDLSVALDSTSKFPPLAVSFVKAGEVSGKLKSALARLAEYLDRSRMVKDAVVSALVYPALMLVTAVLSVGFLLVFVLPEFETLFAGAGKEMPFAPRMLMGLGNALGAYWWLILLSVLAGLLGLQRGLQRPAFRRQWDAGRLTMPLAGRIHHWAELAKICRTFGSLLGGGVALPAATRLSAEVTDNLVLQEALNGTAERLREGQTLTRRLGEAGVFPNMMIDMLRVGEESGKLDVTFLRLADYYEAAVKTRLDRLMSLLVPVMTLLLGVLVAVIVAFHVECGYEHQRLGGTMIKKSEWILSS